MTIAQGTPLLAGAFFDLLFGEAEGYACIRTFKTGTFVPKPGAPVQRHWFQWPQQRETMIAAVIGNPGFDLYIIPALFKDQSSNKASNIKHQTMIYADADSADPSLFHVEPTIIMETSPQRYHLLWKTMTDNSPALCLTGRSIAHAHSHQGCDKGGWDQGQLLRIPGSTNNKPRGTGPFVVRANTTGLVYELEDIQEKYPQLEAVIDSSLFGPMPKPETWASLTEAEAWLNINPDLLSLYGGPPGDRSDRMWRLLSELARREAPKPLAMTVAWNASCCKYRMDNRPYEDLWREMCKAYEQPENAAPKTEAEIEAYLRLRSQEMDAADGGARPKARGFLTPVERANLAKNTVVDRYVAWAATITDAAPQYHRAGIMTVISAVFGEFGLPPTKFYMGRLNLWFLNLGSTTRSRKSTARGMWRRLLKDLQDGTYDYDIGSDVTPEALAEELSHKPGYSSVFHRDEVHGLLGEQASKGYLSGLQENMTELYDGHVRMRKRVGSGEKKKLGTAETTNFIVNFSGVTDHVTNALTADDFASGYLARFLYVFAEPPKRTRESERMEQFTRGSVKTEDLAYNEIVAELKDARELWAKHVKRGDPVRIPWDDDAWDRLNDLAWDLGSAAAETEMAAMIEPVVDRMAKSIIKATCLLAMADRSSRVKMDHLLKAIELAEEWFLHMMVVASRIRESAWKREQDEVIAVLDAANGRMSWTMIYKRFRGKLRPKQFEEIITALSEAGEVTFRIEGRGRVIYRTLVTDNEVAPGIIPSYGAGHGNPAANTQKEQSNAPRSFLDVTDIPA